MMRRLTHMASNIRPSLMFKFLERAKEMEDAGIDVIHLEKGEPEVGTPREIIDAGKEAMEKGYTILTPTKGYIQLRNAISHYLNEEYGLIVDPENEVIVVPGSKFGVFAALAAVCEKGDEVICPSPFFPPHREGVEMVGAKFVPVPIIHKDRRVGLDREDLEKSMTIRSRAILISYPHNPTGWVPSPDELDYIVSFVADHHLLVISDEVYSHLTFDGLKHRTILSFDSIKKNCICVNSFSKFFAMTGWRLGYCIGDREFIAAMAKIQVNVTTCASSISQRAAITGLEKAMYFPRKQLETYEDRRNTLMRELENIPRIYPFKPKGSFFIFIDISGLSISSLAFAEQILEDEHIALVPGIAFGNEWDRFIRISMTEDKDKLNEAIMKFRKFVVTLTN